MFYLLILTVTQSCLCYRPTD